MQTDVFHSCNDPVLFVQFGASAKSEPLVASIPLFSASGSSRLCSLAAFSVFCCFWLVPGLQRPLARPPETRVRADDVVAICRRPGLCPAPGLAEGQNLLKICNSDAMQHLVFSDRVLRPVYTKTDFSEILLCLPCVYTKPAVSPKPH